MTRENKVKYLRVGGCEPIVWAYIYYRVSAYNYIIYERFQSITVYKQDSISRHQFPGIYNLVFGDLNSLSTMGLLFYVNVM